MDVSEIRDEKSLEAWLEDKPPEWAQAIVTRVALRVAPIGGNPPDLHCGEAAPPYMGR